MTPAVTRLCIRCGDFSTEHGFPIARIDVCARCLSTHGRGREPFIVWLTRSVVGRRLVLSVVVYLVIFVPLLSLVGLLIGDMILDDVASLVSRPVLTVRKLERLGYASVILAGSALSAVNLANIFLQFLPKGRPAFRLWACNSVGISADASPFVLAASWLPLTRMRPWRRPGEIGLLGVSEGGIAFVGIEGARRAMPISSITEARVRWRPFPTGFVLHVGLQDGSAYDFSLLEHRKENANRAATRALLAHLERGRLAATLVA